MIPYPCKVGGEWVAVELEEEGMVGEWGHGCGDMFGKIEKGEKEEEGENEPRMVTQDGARRMN
mgnify:CR=1 FL=1